MKTRTKRIILSTIAVVLLLFVGVAVWFWFMMGKPLYEPGMVRMEKDLRSPLTPPTQPGEADFWTMEKGVKLYHYAVGEGPAVLVIHGGPGNPMREPMEGLKPFLHSYRFHYFDQRGCGRSTRPVDRFVSANYYQNMLRLDRALGLGAQIADIERIRRILGEEKLILIGHSFGGFLAALYAAEFPEHVKGLILISPANVLVMPVDDGGLFAAIERSLPENRKPEYQKFIEDYFSYGSIFSNSDSTLAHKNGRVFTYYEEATRNRGLPLPAQATGDLKEVGGWMVQATYMSMGKSHDYRAPLQKVEAPVLVIHGENDMQPESASRIYAQVFPHARFAVIRHAAHFSYIEQPEEFSHVVGEFLSELTH